MPGLDPARLGTLPVRALAPDARHIAAGATTTRVPPGVRRVLLRQRLHALVIGQRPGDPLLSIDGSPVSTLGVATLTGAPSRPN